MGTIESPSTSKRDITSQTIFTPSNPRLPVELFLSIIESDATKQDGTPSSLLIAQTLSAIDLSEVDDEVLESLRVRNKACLSVSGWSGFSNLKRFCPGAIASSVLFTNLKMRALMFQNNGFVTIFEVAKFRLVMTPYKIVKINQSLFDFSDFNYVSHCNNGIFISS